MPLSEFEIETFYEPVPISRRRFTPEEQAAIDAGEISEEEALKKCERSFNVRGLSLMDIDHLLKHHLGDLTKAVELYHERQTNGRMGKATLADFAMILGRDLPLLMVEIISIAADEENQRDKIAKLPAVIQLNALLIIAKLTTEEAGGLKNLVAFGGPLLRGVLGAGAGEPGTLTKKLLDSIGA